MGVLSGDRMGRLRALARATLARLDRPDPQLRAFGGLSDGVWLWLNTEAWRRHPAVYALLPGLPDEALQRTFVGSSGNDALGEAYGFYLLCLAQVKRWRGPLGPDSRVLDFGCGWGRTLRFFIREVRTGGLCGVDPMAPLIDACRITNPWCRFEVTDVLPPLPFEAESLDLVYLYSVFSHLPEDAHDRWLTEFARVLRPGGMLIATTWQREYIERCERGRRGEAVAIHPGSLTAFEDPERWLAAYDRGEYCHTPGEAGPWLPGSLYGETCIPRAYVEASWSDRFRLRAYLLADGDPRLAQNVIVVQR